MTRAHKESGFVLLEAVAALAVTALAAAALMVALNATSTRSAEARIRSLALRQAQALLAETAASLPSDILPPRGEGAHLSWTRTLDEPGQPYPGLQRVVVEVSWRNLQKEGKTRLEAYRNAAP